MRNHAYVPWAPPFLAKRRERRANTIVEIMTSKRNPNEVCMICGNERKHPYHAHTYRSGKSNQRSR